MRFGADSSVCANASCTSTRLPAAAKISAMPCPIRPAPMTATFLLMAGRSAGCRQAAVQVDDLPGDEIRSGRGEEDTKAREVLRLADPLEGHVGDVGLELLGIVERRRGERRADQQRRNRVDVD